MRMYTCLRAKRKRFHRKLPPDWCTSDVHQYGVSIQSSVKLRETFGQITQKRPYDTVLRLGEVLYVLVFYIISFSWLLSLNGFKFIFLWLDSENDFNIGLKTITVCQLTTK